MGALGAGSECPGFMAGDGEEDDDDAITGVCCCDEDGMNVVGVALSIRRIVGPDLTNAPAVGGAL